MAIVDLLTEMIKKGYQLFYGVGGVAFREYLELNFEIIPKEPILKKYRK